MDGRMLVERFGIGGTPLVPMPDLVRRGRVSLKAEYANPFGSVKDRTAAYLLAWARQVGGAGVRVVESTSGNLGLALARLGGELSMVPTLVMDASLPARRIDEVRRAGARVVLAGQCREGMTFRETRIAMANELGRRPGYLWLDQYSNPAGVQAHQETTGPEIWQAGHGSIDVIVASAGTGGTICGIGGYVRELDNPPMTVAVEPVGSTISGGIDGDYLPAGSGMRGPSEVVAMHGKLIDAFAKVPDSVAAGWALALRKRTGLSVGQTTGAAVAVAALLAERDGCHAVAVAPDRGDAFLPAMQLLAAQPRTLRDEELIEVRPYGSAQHNARHRPGSADGRAREVRDAIAALVADQFPWAAPGAEVAGARLRDDLDLDSLHLVQLQVAIEDAFKIVFDAADERLLTAFDTIASLAAYVCHLLDREG
jgi:cysteine synthase/acyl carrier protein